MFIPRLMVFDLDGTLAESKTRMSAEMGELLAKLLKKMPVAVMSGAAFHQFENQFVLSLPDDADLSRLYLFPTNAAQCFVRADSKWHPQYDHAFSDVEQKRIYAAFDDALKEAGLVKSAQIWGEQLEDRGAQITFSAVGQQAPLEAKQEWNKQNDPLRHKLRDILIKKLPDFSVATGGLTSVDVTRKGINKAYGIRKLVELTGIEVSEMLYIGDALEEGGNDSVVLETGVKTHAVFGPHETAALIETILEAKTRV